MYICLRLHDFSSTPRITPTSPTLGCQKYPSPLQVFVSHILG